MLSVVAGVRVEHNASFGTTGVPRVSVSGLVHGRRRTAGDTKVKFNAGLGIKEPTILQSFSPNAFFLGNPSLLAERARTIDFGVEQRVAHDRVKVDVVWFDNDSGTGFHAHHEPGHLRGAANSTSGCRAHAAPKSPPRSRRHRVCADASATRSSHRRILDNTAPNNVVFQPGQWLFRPRHSRIRRGDVGRGPLQRQREWPVRRPSKWTTTSRRSLRRSCATRATPRGCAGRVDSRQLTATLAIDNLTDQS